MLGRCTFCLLISSLAILFQPAAAAGQTGVVRQPLRFAPEPGIGRFRITEPATHYPRFPVRNPESQGFPPFTRAAGTIFSGTVTRIEKRAAHPGQTVETVAITFRVDNAIRGAMTGQILTISQWIGLWSSGQRYRIGERVLLFLYPSSKLGLTSWVGGQMGRFWVDRGGNVLLNSQHLAAFRGDPVLGGRSRVSFSDFALAVRRAGEEE